MNSKSNDKTLLELLRQGLSICAAQNTQENLGNRQAYIGMSDLARYAECPRAAIAGKLSGKGDSLQELITLQRGHWYERGIGDALQAVALNFVHQLEISVEIGAVPIKAHLDFTLVWDQPEPVVRVLEIKSTGNLPENPYESHRFQTLGQISLLRDYWSEPVFKISGTIGDALTFPELCSRNFGFSLPYDATQVSIEGWLVYLSMQNARVFGPYVPEKGVSDTIATLAGSFWGDWRSCTAHPENMVSLEYAKAFHPLCSTCGVNSNCPKFHDGDNVPQWEDALEKLDELKAHRSATDADIKEIEEVLKQVCRNASHQDWFFTDHYRFRLTRVNGRQSLDHSLLREELECLLENYEITDTADDFLQRCTKVGAPTERLVINPVN